MNINSDKLKTKQNQIKNISNVSGNQIPELLWTVDCGMYYFQPDEFTSKIKCGGSFFIISESDGKSILKELHELYVNYGFTYCVIFNRQLGNCS